LLASLLAALGRSGLSRQAHLAMQQEASQRLRIVPTGL
jgi:hypothetical protein